MDKKYFDDIEQFCSLLKQKLESTLKKNNIQENYIRVFLNVIKFKIVVKFSIGINDTRETFSFQNTKKLYQDIRETFEILDLNYKEGEIKPMIPGPRCEFTFKFTLPQKFKWGVEGSNLGLF